MTQVNGDHPGRLLHQPVAGPDQAYGQHHGVQKGRQRREPPQADTVRLRFLR